MNEGMMGTLALTSFYPFIALSPYLLTSFSRRSAKSFGLATGIALSPNALLRGRRRVGIVLIFGINWSLTVVVPIYVPGETSIGANGAGNVALERRPNGIHHP
jgi:hypothetical protein